MTVDLLLSRYCEDISWIDRAPAEWRRVIYDKSAGGERQMITVGNWTSRAGPNGAAVWPGATRLPNVGCESHTQMHHFVEHYDDLADYMVCLSGDALDHDAGILEQAAECISTDAGYRPFGREWTCDQLGRPNVPKGFAELRQGFEIFLPGRPMPAEFHWHGWGMFVVRRDRVLRYSREQWRQARAWCQAKVHSLAMERLYDTIFA